MTELTVHGEVIRAIGADVGLRIENADEIRTFWQVHQIDTKLNWIDNGAPVVSINRQCDIASCKTGDRASMTIATQDRSNGKRGIRTVDFRVLAGHA